MKKIFPQGFSLIELILALGVISTSLVGLLGLMTVGFSQLHESGEKVVHAQIVRGVAAEIEMLDFSGITAFAEEFPRYYNDEGQRVTTETDVAYKVSIDLKNSKLPGATPSAETARQLVLTITDRQKIAKVYGIWAVNNGE